MPEEFPKKIERDVRVGFTVDRFGLYAISATANCEKEHDLKVEIDDLYFRELPPEKITQTYNIPPAWNGVELKGLSKTIIFVVALNKGSHTLKFFPKDRAKIERWSCRLIRNVREIKFEVGEKAEDGNRRPWFTLVEKNTNSRLWKYWAWHATPEQMISGLKREQKVFNKDLPQGIHYIEFWADKTPTLHQITLDLGVYTPKQVPTVEDPKWTGILMTTPK